MLYKFNIKVPRWYNPSDCTYLDLRGIFMTDYTDKALQSSANRRRILNAGDSNTVNAVHEFKATTTVGGLIVDEDSHKGGTSDANAGKISTDRGHGTIELDGQEIIVSRTGGSAWNSLILGGNDATSSTVELTHGTNRRISKTGVDGFRFGFCAVSAHTSTAFSGGLEAERNNALFLQSGSGATVSNILDISLADGEVFFYKGLRSTDSTGRIKLSGHTIETYKTGTLSANDAVGTLTFKGDNSGSTTKEFAQVVGIAKDPSDGSESGRVNVNVLGSAGLLTGLSVYAEGSSSSIVKISNTWTLPDTTGSNNQVLTSNGSGASSWASIASDLNAITANGSTTSNSLTTGSLLPNASTDNLGSSSALWSALHLKAGGTIHFGANDVRLTSSAGVGLIVDMTGEGDGEPKFQLKSDTQSNASGPTLSILPGSIPSTNEVIGAVNLSAFDAGENERDYAIVDATAIDTTTSAVDGSLRFRVAVNGSIGTGLEVLSNQTSRLVKISDTWVLPSATGTNGQVLTTNGSGTSTWADAPTSGGSSSVGDLSDVTLGGVAKDEGQVLRLSSDDSTFVNAVLSYNDLSDRPTLGSSAAKDAGTSNGEVLLLAADDALPAICGASPTALPSIDKASDVDISTTEPTNGQMLHWVSADSKFKPTTPAYYTDEQARDSAGTALASGTHTGVEAITFTNDDSNDKINLSLTIETGNLSDIDTTSPTNKQVLRYTTDSSLNKYKPASLGTAADVDVGTEPNQVPSISDHYLATGTHAEKGDLIIFGRVLETIDYGSVATTWSSASHFSIDFGLITDTLLYASEDYGVLVA